jgi:rRNA processing protein Gar1
MIITQTNSPNRLAKTMRSKSDRSHRLILAYDYKRMEFIQNMQDISETDPRVSQNDIKNEEDMTIMNIEVNDLDDDDDDEGESMQKIPEMIADCDETDLRMTEVVMNDLEYIAKFAEVPVFSFPEESLFEDHADADECNDESSDDEDSKSEGADHQDAIGESSSSSGDDSDIEEIKDNKKSKASVTTMLTEEEEECFNEPSGPPRTKHEISVEAEEEELDNSTDNRIPRFPQKIEDIQLLTKVGKVQSLIKDENTLIIQSYPTMSPLNESSIFLNQDGIVLGKISEIFGPVTAPFYIIRFSPQPSSTSADSSSEEGKETATMTIPSMFPPGTVVYTAPSYAAYITPRYMSTLKAKGSDASNAYDEEVRCCFSLLFLVFSYFLVSFLFLCFFIAS